MKRDGKMLAVVTSVLCLVLSCFLMGAKGCEGQSVDPAPRPVKSTKWTNEAENKVGTAEFGAYCDGKDGQESYTPNGIPVRCKANPGERRPRWRNR